MAYSVKEMYLTLQGEGAQMGQTAVFLRFTGCNLWSGLEADRSKAVCQFCDTDFVGMDGPNGGRFENALSLVNAVDSLWLGSDREPKWIVCTGGEPLLQLDEAIITALHDQGFKIAVETNGTQRAPAGIDWLCVSPKADAPLIQTRGDELKLVYPQTQNHPRDFTDLDFTHFSLQPLDGPNRQANTEAAIAYCLAHPLWRLSLQSHKYLGID